MTAQQKAEDFLKRLDENCTKGFPQVAQALKAAIVKKSKGE